VLEKDGEEECSGCSPPVSGRARRSNSCWSKDDKTASTLARKVTATTTSHEKKLGNHPKEPDGGSRPKNCKDSDYHTCVVSHSRMRCQSWTAPISACISHVNAVGGRQAVAFHLNLRFMPSSSLVVIRSRVRTFGGWTCLGK
jgi:hypothetical protein